MDIWEEIKPENILQEHFKNPFKMDPDWLRLLAKIQRRANAICVEYKLPRVELGKRIISDYRDDQANANAVGAKNSAHKELPCRCCDIDIKEKDEITDSIERFVIMKAALDCGVLRIGLYVDRGAIHLDGSKTLPQPRIWTTV